MQRLHWHKRQHANMRGGTRDLKIIRQKLFAKNYSPKIIPQKLFAKNYSPKIISQK